MKFNKTMTKILSALIMASMVGTSVQIPTLAEITSAGQAMVDGMKDNNAKDAGGSTESSDTDAAGDEDNKDKEDAEAKEAAASENAANAEGSQGEGRTSSSSAAYNNSSSASSNTSKILEPFSTENDSKELSFENSFSLFSYFGAKQTFTAIAANGDGNDIAWEVDPTYLSLSEARVDGDKSTVDITWDGEMVEDIERTPFYAMLKSNPFEKITGTAYLSNGSAPAEDDTIKIDAGSKT